MNLFFFLVLAKNCKAEDKWGVRHLQGIIHLRVISFQFLTVSAHVRKS